MQMLSETLKYFIPVSRVIQVFIVVFLTPPVSDVPERILIKLPAQFKKSALYPGRSGNGRQVT
jgi:hypothetical protein